MKFLHERQTRRFYFFLAAALALQTGVLGLLSILQVRNIREFLAKRELAAVSYLLEQDIPVQTMSEILGHARVGSTKVYLQVDLEGLRKCAMDPDKVFANVEK